MSTAYTNNPFRFFTYTIPNNGIQTILYEYTTVSVLSLSNPSGVYFRFGDSGSEANVLSAGFSFTHREKDGTPAVLQSLIIRNASGGSITVTVALGVGDIADNRITLLSDVTLARDTQCISKVDVAVPAASSASVSNGNSTKRGVWLSNLASNGTIVRIGDASVAANRGVELPIGASIYMESTEQIYCYNPSGATIYIGNVDIRV